MTFKFDLKLKFISLLIRLNTKMLQKSLFWYQFNTTNYDVVREPTKSSKHLRKKPLLRKYSNFLLNFSDRSLICIKMWFIGSILVTFYQQSSIKYPHEYNIIIIGRFFSVVSHQPQFNAERCESEKNEIEFYIKK